MECEEPMQLYIDLVASCPVAHEQADMCAESLLAMGAKIVKPILDKLGSATDAGQDTFLDLLCNYPGDERIYELAIRKFISEKTRHALFASYLAKLGDERALPLLIEASQAQETNYLDYVEICNAIESLGGELPPAREYEGDPYYESLKTIE